MKRIFIAVETGSPERLRMLLSEMKGKFVNDTIKWTSAENMHVTISFLGDTSDEKISQIDRMLKSVSEKIAPFELEISGTGLFGSYNEPKVLWIGTGNSEVLYRLNKEVVKGLTELGIKADPKSYFPHITLGRIRRINNTTDFRNEMKNYVQFNAGIFKVNELILYESILWQSGPIYIPLGKYRLLFGE